MRMPGYCASCHRFRQVRVAPSALAMLAQGTVTERAGFAPHDAEGWEWSKANAQQRAEEMAADIAGAIEEEERAERKLALQAESEAQFQRGVELGRAWRKRQHSEAESLALRLDEIAEGDGLHDGDHDAIREAARLLREAGLA